MCVHGLEVSTIAFQKEVVYMRKEEKKSCKKNILSVSQGSRVVAI